MPRTRVRYNWRQDLSQPRYTSDRIQGQQLRNERTAQQVAQFPLEQQARVAQLSRAQAAEAQARYKLNKEIETDRQRTAFYNGLQELEETLSKRGFPIGTKEHAEAFAAYAHAVPLARSSSDVAQTLKLHAVVNDDQAALTERMQRSIAAGKELGLQPAGASFVKGGNVDVRFKMPEDTETPEATAAPAADAGVKAATDYGQEQGAPTTDDIKQMLTPDASTAPSATPSATADPRVDLAQRALNDPSATEAHKAAARRILGVQEDNAAE